MSHLLGVILQTTNTWHKMDHLSKFHRNRTFRALETDDFHVQNRLFLTKPAFFTAILMEIQNSGKLAP